MPLSAEEQLEACAKAALIEEDVRRMALESGLALAVSVGGTTSSSGKPLEVTQWTFRDALSSRAVLCWWPAQSRALALGNGEPAQGVDNAWDALELARRAAVRACSRR